jgi:hypothetical protein
MAIISGAGPHFAWLSVGGGTFPVIEALKDRIDVVVWHV